MLLGVCLRIHSQLLPKITQSILYRVRKYVCCVCVCVCARAASVSTLYRVCKCVCCVLCVCCVCVCARRVSEHQKSCRQRGDLALIETCANAVCVCA